MGESQDSNPQDGLSRALLAMDEGPERAREVAAAIRKRSADKVAEALSTRRDEETVLNAETATATLARWIDSTPAWDSDRPIVGVLKREVVRTTRPYGA
jgi:acyl-CoA synthetase (NDP forming)